MYMILGFFYYFSHIFFHSNAYLSLRNVGLKNYDVKNRLFSLYKQKNTREVTDKSPYPELIVSLIPILYRKMSLFFAD